MNPLDLLKTAWGRLTAGVTLILTVAWLNDGQITGLIDWRATTAFVAAFLAWLYGCLPDRAKASEHDKQLFQRFRLLLDDQALDMLREQDFGAAFWFKRLDGMQEVAVTWNGANFDFDDPAIKKAFSPLLTELRAFSRELRLNTHVQPGGEMARMAWDHDNEAACLTVQKKLNDGSTSLSQAIDRFIPLARRRLA
jgi:hypothetical protein